jgi:hypothetical protein
MASFLTGALSATTVALHFGVRLLPKQYLDRVATTVVEQENDPAALARLHRTDRLFAEEVILTNYPAKASFDPPASPKADADLAKLPQSSPPQQIADTAEDLLPSENYGDSASVAGAEQTPDPQGKLVKPSLYYDAVTKQRMIGNFETRAFPGDSATCSEIGHSMAKDGSDGHNALQTLADTGAITVIRICAANGSVIISCRAGQVTVSPRAARPDDKCDGYRAKQLATN